MTTTFARRAWLTNRNPHPEPTLPATLSPDEIRDRIDELERLFASAPPDQSRIVGDLRSGRLSTTDLHAALTDASTAQTQRDSWILAHWPDIVEHHELRCLADKHDSLAQWPAPLRPTVQTVLDNLAAALDLTALVEQRSLGQLHDSLAALDPGRRLRELTENLVRVNDGLADVRSQLEVETDPQRRALLTSERDTLATKQADARAMVEAERVAIDHRRWGPNEADDLRAAIVHRTTTIYQHAVAERPAWAIELLNELDDRGTLEQLRPTQIRQLILDAAERQDLGTAQAHQIRRAGPQYVLAR